MMAQEMITLQLGHYSNHIGTHWWNIQESSFNYNETLDDKPQFNPDVTFREGLNLRRQITYTPRVVYVDLKKNFGNAPLHHSKLYDNDIDSYGRQLLLFLACINCINKSIQSRN